MNKANTPAPYKIVRHLYGDRRIQCAPAARKRQTFVSGPTRVRQEFGHEADINNVILRYTNTGELPPRLNPVEPQYLDVSDVPELQVALQRVRDAHLELERITAESSAKRAALPDPASGLPPAPPVPPSGGAGGE